MGKSCFLDSHLMNMMPKANVKPEMKPPSGSPCGRRSRLNSVCLPNIPLNLPAFKGPFGANTCVTKERNSTPSLFTPTSKCNKLQKIDSQLTNYSSAIEPPRVSEIK